MRTEGNGPMTDRDALRYRVRREARLYDALTTDHEKRMDQVDAGAWAAYARQQEARAEARERPHRDLDTVDAGVLGPSVDEQKAFQQDYDRMVGDA